MGYNIYISFKGGFDVPTELESKFSDAAIAHIIASRPNSRITVIARCNELIAKPWCLGGYVLMSVTDTNNQETWEIVGLHKLGKVKVVKVYNVENLPLHPRNQQSEYRQCTLPFGNGIHYGDWIHSGRCNILSPNCCPSSQPVITRRT